MKEREGGLMERIGHLFLVRPASEAWTARMDPSIIIQHARPSRLGARLARVPSELMSRRSTQSEQLSVHAPS